MLGQAIRGEGGRKKVRVALLCLSVAFAIGCGTSMRPIEIVPAGMLLPVDDPRAAKVLRDYQVQVESRKALRGSARVALAGEGFALNRPQRIAVERPARLRFEILALFDQIAAILVTDGERFDFYDASTGEIQRGRVRSTLLWDLAKIDLAPEEVVGLLLGAPMPEPGTHRAGVWLEPEGRLALAFAWPTQSLELACASDDPWGVFFVPTCSLPEQTVLDMGGQLFFFDQDGKLVELRVLDPGGEIRYRAHFEQYEALPAAATAGEGQAEGQSGVVFPKRILLESPMVQSSARFEWKRVMLADDLSDRLFQLPEPRRARQGG